MKTRCCLFLILLYNFLAVYTCDEGPSHKLVKRQLPARPGGFRAFPLSRSRQFPPPEELEESEEYETSEDEEGKSPVSHFRGRQPQAPPSEEDYSEDYSYTEAPKTTTPTPQKPTARTVVFNNRFAGRPRLGLQSSTSTTTTTTTTRAPKSTTTASSRSRFRATPAQSQRFDVVANILNKPPPPRSSERSATAARTPDVTEKPAPPLSTNDSSSRRANNSRPRSRGRFRTRTSSTTTTTTTTEPPLEEYYYYYEDDDASQKNQPIATTTSTTTTTTPKPSLPKRVSVGRRQFSGRSQSTPKPVVKFDPESQFAPPPEDVVDVLSEPSSTKKFTTSTTSATPADIGGIPAHLRSKYKPRTDGRFIDFLRDPNRPRELKGFDLTDYPFYVKVPEDIDFDCEDKKDGYYASVPHKCQLFHYCFAGARYDFLCANYTLYDQTTFTCRFANNVDCPSSEKYYYRNDDLWKETTSAAPETTTPKKRRTTPRDEDYEEDDYYDEYDEEEERRRRPPKRRRNRRKNRRKPQEE